MLRLRRLAALGQAPAPATRAALDRATKPGPAVAALVAALALVQERQLVVAPVVAVAARAAETEPGAAPAQGPATPPALVQVINPEVVGTNSRFRGGLPARQLRSPGQASGAVIAHGSPVTIRAVGRASIGNVESVDHRPLQARVTLQ